MRFSKTTWIIRLWRTPFPLRISALYPGLLDNGPFALFDPEPPEPYNEAQTPFANEERLPTGSLDNGPPF